MSKMQHIYQSRSILRVRQVQSVKIYISSTLEHVEVAVCKRFLELLRTSVRAQVDYQYPSTYASHYVFCTLHS